MSASLKNMSILVLDNESRIAQMITDVLNKLGFPMSNLVRASDGFEGLEILRKRSVDIVIVDWELLPQKEYLDLAENAVVRSRWGDLPPVNGASFVKCLRCSPQSPNPFVPVLMLTAPTKVNHIMFARDAGVNEILVKPIVAEDLARRIVQIVEHPREFITCTEYRGPCRRRRQAGPPPGSSERRRKEVKIIRYQAA
jgi:DNA-binding response OmpR family regulator